MRSGGNNFNYFPENKLTKLADFVQFMHMLMICLEDLGGGGLGSLGPLATPLVSSRLKSTCRCQVESDVVK